MLLLRHPNVAALSCTDCAQWMTNEDWTFTRRRDERGKLTVLQPRRGLRTPCEKCPKVPQDAPEPSARYAVELTERHHATLIHYHRCRAVGQWPDDPIVARNAAAIRRAYDLVEAWRTDEMRQLLAAVLSMKGR